MRYLEEINEQKMFREEVAEKNRMSHIRGSGHVHPKILHVGNSTHLLQG